MTVQNTVQMYYVAYYGRPASADELAAGVATLHCNCVKHWQALQESSFEGQGPVWYPRVPVQARP